MILAVVLRPCSNYYPVKVGDHVHIGAGSIVEAASIGNYVEIGKNCIIVSRLLVFFASLHLSTPPPVGS